MRMYAGVFCEKLKTRLRRCLVEAIAFARMLADVENEEREKFRKVAGRLEEVLKDV